MTQTYKMPAWSYSALTAFETCPHRYFKARVDKEFPEGQTEATLWGNRVHKSLEDCVKTGLPLPDGMQQWQEIASKFRSAFEGGTPVLIEKKLAINKFYRPVQWMASDAWCRGIVDVAVWKGTHIFAADWKTGKRRVDSDQMKLMAGMLFAHYSEVRTITTLFVWLKEDTTDKDKFNVDNTSDIWNIFLPRVKAMEDAYEKNKWPKRPSGLCRGWCPVKTCEHWEAKK